ncbi:MAG: hypothetical protein KH032_10955 [[Clostridium] spiroforme]|uniref:hypothetical protein n=1 Tax=Thomasclavelia spiroformis TaxID=29348 RepID=UPI001DB7E5FF|nr:hypothetical protein [Thomasclavelia spiroformis]MBS7217744.1 hypothetical protein [Thomasclavelia spiroformis]
MIIYCVVKLPHPCTKIMYGIVGQEFDLYGSLLNSIVIPDISCDYLLVLKIAEQCTLSQLDLEQLYDVVYDMLP